MTYRPLGHRLKHDAVLDTDDTLHRPACVDVRDGVEHVPAEHVIWRRGAAPRSCMRCFPEVHTVLTGAPADV